MSAMLDRIERALRESTPWPGHLTSDEAALDAWLDGGPQPPDMTLGEFVNATHLGKTGADEIFRAAAQAVAAALESEQAI